MSDTQTMNREQASVVHAESPVTVYPQATGSIVYGDVRFNVSLRQGGTFSMAVDLMDEFLANIELISADCRVSLSTPKRTEQAAGAKPPAQQPTSNASTPPARGNEDEAESGVYRVTRLCRVLNEDGSPKFKAFYLYEKTGQESQYQLFVKDKDYDNLCLALEARGFHPEEWVAGQVYALAINIGWIRGNPIKNKSGKFYKNLRTFDVQA